MKVVQEAFTIIPDATLHEVSVVLAGMRISFNSDETRRLVTELSKALQALGSAEARKGMGLSETAAESEMRDITAELRAAKDDSKRIQSIPRAG